MRGRSASPPPAVGWPQRGEVLALAVGSGSQRGQRVAGGADPTGRTGPPGGLVAGVGGLRGAHRLPPRHPAPGGRRAPPHPPGPPRGRPPSTSHHLVCQRQCPQARRTGPQQRVDHARDRDRGGRSGRRDRATGRCPSRRAPVAGRAASQSRRRWTRHRRPRAPGRPATGRSQQRSAPPRPARSNRPRRRPARCREWRLRRPSTSTAGPGSRRLRSRRWERWSADLARPGLPVPTGGRAWRGVSGAGRPAGPPRGTTSRRAVRPDWAGAG